MKFDQSIYREIAKEYEMIRQNNKELQNARKDEIYGAFPDVKKIDDDIAKKTFERVLGEMNSGLSPDESYQKLKVYIQEKIAEKKKILKKNGYNENYLESIYTCSDCKDTGVLGSGRCNCFLRKINAQYYSVSNLEELLSKQNFENFNFKYYSDEIVKGKQLSPLENAKNAVLTLENYIQHFFDTDKNIFIYGASGTGKTFLSCAVTKELIEKGVLTIYQTAYKLAELFEECKFSKGDYAETKNHIETIKKCDFLIIDDLGAQTSEAFIISAFLDLIDERIMKGKKMLITSNYSIDALEKIFGTRFASRINGNFVPFELFGDDIRKKKIIID